ncbi:MAG: LamG-like jellyroll fold domain-containing protein [Verrucomicrobiota bacterium]|jgi:WD40 repeat protein
MKLNLFLSNRVQKMLCAASLGLAFLPAAVEAFPAPQWMQGGHAARISGVACSPDGSMIASSSEDGTLKLWSTNGALLRTLNTQPYPATAIAWSPDGTRIAAGTYYGGGLGSSVPGHGLTCLWQASSGSQSAWTSASVGLVHMSTNRYGKVTALAFSTDGAKLACGGAAGSNLVTSVSSWSFLAGCPAYNTSVRASAVTSVAFSSRGLMASGCEDSTICVFSTNSSWTQLWSSTTNANAHTTNVTAVAFAPDGSLLASASLDQTIKIWSTTNWACLQTLSGHTNGVSSVAFSPNGQKIVSGSVDGTVKIWNRAGGNCLVTIPAHALPVTATVFSTDGTLVISASDDGTVRLWSAADGSAVGTLGGQNYFIGNVVVSPDGTLCASAGGSRIIQIRRTSDCSLVQTLAANTNYVSSLAFSPDSARLASGGGPLDPTIKIWQISNGALLNTIPATTNGVMALAWSPDGLTLAAGGDSIEQNITFWSTNGTLRGTLAGTLSWHTNGVTALAFSRQGNLLASGGRRPGNTVRIWTNSVPGIWTTASLVQTFYSPSTTNNVECVAFSPDGSSVAYGSTAVNVLNVGRISDGANTTRAEADNNPVFSVAFSPDGSTLAASDQNTVQLWTTDGSLWALTRVITQEVVRASCLAYSPVGNQLLCGREDGTVTMTSYTPADLLVTVGAASNPSPANNSSGAGINATLSWTPGSNALTHALYVGSNSNAVAHATPASPELRGYLGNNSFAPALLSDATNYWRVDELAGFNSAPGAVWSFATVPMLGHRYSFLETGGTTTADSVGGSAWNGTVYNGGTLAGGQLQLSSSSNQYVNLPLGIVSTLGNFTIELWVKLTTTANWTRIFDFGTGTSVYMFLTPQNGNNGDLRFSITTSGNGNEQQLTGPAALTTGGWNHIAVTHNGNTGILYLNGVAVATNSSMTLTPSSLGNTGNNYIGRSQWSDPYLNGAVEDFRIYNMALSPAEIAATDAMGPGQPLSINSPFMSQSGIAGNLTLAWPLASAPYNLQTCTNLTAGNWVTVQSPAPQVTSTNIQVTLMPTNAVQFFRLSR